MSLVAAGNFLFRFRNFLVPLAFPLVLAPGPRLAADPLGPLLVGTALACAGQCLRALTIGLKYIVRGGRNRRVYADALVTDGVFAHTRNPLYLGNLLILAGIAAASNSLVCAVVAPALAVLAYAAIVAAEEEYLRGRFGAAYDDYAKAVPRWSIRLTGSIESLRGGQFRWRRLLVKEYGTTAAWILALSLAAWLSLERSEGEERLLRVALPFCMAGAALFWGTARWLKKSRAVVAD